MSGKSKAGRDAKGRFTPGNAGGNGRKKMPPDIRAVRSLSYANMIQTVVEVRQMTPAQARELDLEKMPLGRRVILKAYLEADYRAVAYYEDRVFGKAPLIVDLTLDPEARLIDVDKFSDAQLLEYMEKKKD